MKFHRSLRSSCSLLCLLALLPIQGFAADNSDHLSPRAEVSVKGGSKRSILTTEFWAPLAQKSGKVLYGDLRLMGDNDDNREGNLGFGYRQIVESTDSVIGGHLWIDRRRTEHNSTFHQVTIGAESLGTSIDLRANAYIPLNGANKATTPNLGSTTPYLAGSGLYYDTNGSVSETPQYGADAEIGYRLPILKKQFDTLRIYGGGYSFFRDNTDSVNGYRVRTEAVINSIFSVGARFQHDAPRGDQGFLEATIRFPFSAKKLYQSKGLYGRLDESPERDVDIVTSSKTTSGLMTPFLNASGAQQRILYVDNTAANGDGTKEHPFNNLTSAQAALQARDILYIASGDGTNHNMDQGITISQPNVTLVGSGSALTFGGFTFLAAGAAPVLTNIQPTPGNNLLGNAITVTADNADISGITTYGQTTHGIYVSNLNNEDFENITIHNVQAITTTTANNNYAILVSAKAGGGSIKNVNLYDITTNGGNGISVATGTNSTINNVNVNNIDAHNVSFAIVASGNGHFDTVNISNITEAVGFNGVAIQMGSTGVIDTVNINNVSASANSNSGVLFGLAGTVNNANLSNITTSNNSQVGIRIDVQGTNARLNQITLTNVISEQNPNGVSFYADQGGIINNVLTTNSRFNNGIGTGVAVGTRAGGTIGNTVFTNVVANGNQQYGFFGFGDPSGGSAVIGHIELQDFTANNNALHGVNILATAGGTMGSLLFNNIITNSNGQSGIAVSTGTAGSVIGSVDITNATVNQNRGGTGGISINSVGGTMNTVNVSNTNATNNLSNGILVRAQNIGKIGDITISNNIVNNNTGAGIFAFSQLNALINSATITGNTTNANAAGGINVWTQQASRINSANVLNNTANNNTGTGGYGIFLTSNDTFSVIGNLTASGNTTNNNAQNGIFLQASYGNISTAVLSNNTANTNAGPGIGVSSLNGSIISSVSLLNNTATGNTGTNGQGLAMLVSGSSGAITSSTVTGNNFSNNAQQGVSISALNNTTFNASLIHNTITGNASNGVFVNKGTSGTFVVDLGGGTLGSTGQNRIWNNTGTEMRVDGNYALKAQTNYWGGGDLVVGEKTLNGGSTVDSTGFLTVDPGP